MPKMGGLAGLMPQTHRVMLIATLAIAGIIPFAGFVSKDAILWGAFAGPFHSTLVWVVGMAVAGMTAFYMFRLYFLTFHGQPRWGHEVHPHESPPVMMIPLWILAVLSVIGGLIGWPHALGGGDWFGAFLEPMWPDMPSGAHAGMATEWLLMALTLGLAVGGILAARYFYKTHPNAATAWAEKLSGIHRVLKSKYWIDELYDALFVRPLVAFSQFLWRFVDVVLIDGFANLLATLTARFGQLGSRVQTGVARNYILVFTFGVVLALGYFALDWKW
jgi:NADH-quinone oxidoreductase subunit L